MKPVLNQKYNFGDFIIIELPNCSPIYGKIINDPIQFKSEKKVRFKVEVSKPYVDVGTMEVLERFVRTDQVATVNQIIKKYDHQ